MEVRPITQALLEDTLVIWSGEFGRTPFLHGKIEKTKHWGRDHHPDRLAGENLDGGGVVRDFYRMKATTMTLSSKRQSVFPQDWCERVGLAEGGPVNAFDLGEQGLLIRPVTPPTKAEVSRLLKQMPAGRHSPAEAAEVVGRALRKVCRK